MATKRKPELTPRRATVRTVKESFEQLGFQPGDALALSFRQLCEELQQMNDYLKDGIKPAWVQPMSEEEIYARIVVLRREVMDTGIKLDARMHGNETRSVIEGDVTHEHKGDEQLSASAAWIAGMLGTTANSEDEVPSSH